MGPPTAAPNSLLTSLGLSCPTGRKNGLALRWLSVWKENNEPRRLFVPLLIWTLTADPPASPCSASKLLVTTLTVSSDSRAGTYAATCGSQMFVVLTPSIRMLLELRLAPLTLKTSAREGFDGTECASAGGVKPGNTRNRYWKF